MKKNYLYSQWLFFREISWPRYSYCPNDSLNGNFWPTSLQKKWYNLWIDLFCRRYLVILPVFGLVRAWFFLEQVGHPYPEQPDSLLKYRAIWWAASHSSLANIFLLLSSSFYKHLQHLLFSLSLHLPGRLSLDVSWWSGLLNAQTITIGSSLGDLTNWVVSCNFAASSCFFASPLWLVFPISMQKVHTFSLRPPKCSNFGTVRRTYCHVGSILTKMRTLSYFYRPQMRPDICLTRGQRKKFLDAWITYRNVIILWIGSLPPKLSSRLVTRSSPTSICWNGPHMPFRLLSNCLLGITCGSNRN